MKPEKGLKVRIIGVPLDLGASRRGTDMGPSALRIAGLGNALRRMGYTVDREEDIPAPAMETGTQDTMREIDEHGMAKVARRALEIVNNGTAGFHISFDVDGCDPMVMPGSGTLVPGGVSFREAHLLMEYCADDGNLLSMEIVELNPFLDEGNVSAERAMELLLSAMGKSIL